MKFILIVGFPRCGKRELARMIQEELTADGQRVNTFSLLDDIDQSDFMHIRKHTAVRDGTSFIPKYPKSALLAEYALQKIDKTADYCIVLHVTRREEVEAFRAANGGPMHILYIAPPEGGAVGREAFDTEEYSAVADVWYLRLHSGQAVQPCETWYYMRHPDDKRRYVAQQLLPSMGLRA